MEEYKKTFKSLDEIFLNSDIKVPEIIYLANKSENGYEGDVLGEFYHMFPHIKDSDIAPIFVSSEHGDGLPDLYQAIKAHIPPS